jgi:HAD superfamily hydrolase (TIGR01509 family)
MLGIESCTASRIENLKQIKTLEMIADQATVMPEKQELHSYLKSQGIKIACVTNSIHITATAMLRQTGQIKFMDLIVSNGDVPNNKPYPDCYNFAVKTLGVDPSACLCVEDSPKGVAAARASCVPNLWVVANPSEVTLENYKEIVK